MNFKQFMRSRLVKFLLSLTLSLALLAPLSQALAVQTTEVIVEIPQLHPAFITCRDSHWYPFTNNRGYTAYLTLNASNPSNSSNYGEWRPVIPQSGYYKVEAYIAAHSSIIWCNDQGWPIAHDTTDAHYSIHHVYGVSTRSLSQYPLSNQWLDLGEYYFNSGDNGYVALTDLNDEPDFDTTISFSAMRFTLTSLSRPRVYLPLVQHADPSGRPPPDAGVIQAQGFDACHLPTISEMQTWMNQSPYSFYGLYLGGIHLPSICVVANADWIRVVHQQGWSFIPTWVGPQAPCTDYHYKMSADPAVSYQEGRQEAQAASAAAASIGLTNYGLGGTVIYYDLEAYGVSTLECRQPVSAFMNGWVERLHELGNLAGGYGTRNSYISDWSTIPHVPDDVWPASWYANTYDPYASVYGISWLEGLWNNHQRVRQYAGDHSEKWGTVTFNIDSDVADGMVAMPSSKPLTNPIVTTSPYIEDAGWLSAEQGWLVSGNHLYLTSDRGKNWADISPAPIQLAYFLPSGQAWTISNQSQGSTSLYLSSNWGSTWESLELIPPNDSWRAIQLYFTTPTTGWVVLQKETSQAFDLGILMKTIDGGLTWQTYRLPTAARIDFSTQDEWWLRNDMMGEFYLTTDGGLTWQIAPLDADPLSKPLLPEGTTLSGWQAHSFGWAATSVGTCSGEKFTPNFTCQLNTALLQSQDGGTTWDAVPLPSR